MKATVSVGRPATEKQIAYLTSLAEQVGHPVPDHVDLTTWTTAEASEMIDRLKARVPADAPRMATERQVEYLRGLLAEREWDADDLDREAPMVAEYMVPGLGLESKITADLASAAIRTLKVAPRRPVQAQDAYENVPDGNYAILNASGKGDVVFYRVWTRRDGSRGVDLQVSDDYLPVARAQVPGILDRIAQDPGRALTRYGHEIGRCGVCNRTLTDEVSRERGIGPVCASKYGF